MEIYGQSSYSYPFLSVSASMEKQESSSSTLSDASSARRVSDSDVEGHLLATSRPKKRAGRRVFKETRHPVYRGVRQRNRNKWVCELREPNKKTRIWLGTYPTPEMAARAHDVAALALRGKSACLNFADSTWRLPVPSSNDAMDIRKTAAEAAEAFRPDEFAEVSDGEVRNEKISPKASTEVSCDCNNKEEEVKTLDVNTYLPESDYFMDEEALFDLPGLLAEMAAGLLLSPPPLLAGNDVNWEDVESDDCVSLWSHSI
ncbi:dehydration-responsive element-binding protein 1C-like [Pistacia vera]|uniref:dehydration-responsive element-binding protein 1C-like n=1 Tax=Pistacia vera TaxID=55513 RepID=UPI00126303F9|nr:dehydration-responsive element-binding protein 1C-like [Pistacia vera]